MMYLDLCQCPVSGESHFYSEEQLREYQKRTLCQCPVSGESHFYPVVLSGQTPSDIVCQCPVSGESHFYGRNGAFESKSIMCVNALSRANPISTQKMHISKGTAVKVSMPCLGRIPFLPE